MSTAITIILFLGLMGFFLYFWRLRRRTTGYGKRNHLKYELDKIIDNFFR